MAKRHKGLYMGRRAGRGRAGVILLPPGWRAGDEGFCVLRVGLSRRTASRPTLESSAVCFACFAGGKLVNGPPTSDRLVNQALLFLLCCVLCSVFVHSSVCPCLSVCLPACLSTSLAPSLPSSLSLLCFFPSSGAVRVRPQVRERRRVLVQVRAVAPER